MATVIIAIYPKIMNTILIVEDSPTQRECLSYQLTWSGMKVIQAGDGIEALKQIKTNSPDLILLDMVMPRMNGYSLCRLLKANPKTRNTPTILLTGIARDFAIDKGIKHAEAYLNKPWQPLELLETINKTLLNAKGLRHAASASAWNEYGILLLKIIEFYKIRGQEAATKYATQIDLIYDCALAAFDQALLLDSQHEIAAKYYDKVRREWGIFIAKLAETKPCRVCQFYHGKEGINCALHPAGREEELCRDWEL